MQGFLITTRGVERVGGKTSSELTWQIDDHHGCDRASEDSSVEIIIIVIIVREHGCWTSICMKSTTPLSVCIVQVGFTDRLQTFSRDHTPKLLAQRVPCYAMPCLDHRIHQKGRPFTGSWRYRVASKLSCHCARSQVEATF